MREGWQRLLGRFCELYEVWYFRSSMQEVRMEGNEDQHLDRSKSRGGFVGCKALMYKMA